MLSNREEDLMARMQRARAGIGPASAERGVFMSALDYVNRPYSAIMGGITGLVDDELGVGEGAWQGLSGARQFGVYDALVSGGADPDSNWTKGAGFVGDILNPLDPLTYLTLGFNKAGRVAKGLGKGLAAADDALSAGTGAARAGAGITPAMVATREAAAEAGLWHGVRFAGQPLLPKKLNVEMAKGVDRLAGVITQSAGYKTLQRHVGGVQKFEKVFGGLVPFLRGRRRLDEMNYEEFIAEVGKVDGQLAAAGKSEQEIDSILREAMRLMEPATMKMRRLGKELEDVDEGLKRGDVVTRAQDFLGRADQELVTRVARLDQDEVQRRLAELGQAPSLTPQLRNERAVLESVSVTRLAGDLPPREDLWLRREALQAELKGVQKKWDSADAVVQQTSQQFMPLLESAQSVYEERAAAFGGIAFPIEDYVKHLLPVQVGRLPSKVAKKQAKLAEEVAERERGLVAKYAEKGWNDEAIQRQVRQDLREEYATLGLRGNRDPELHQFSQRKHDLTIEESIALHREGRLDWHFEDHAGVVAAATYRDAQRWGYQFDAHDFVRKQEGWTLDAAGFGRLSKAEQRAWEPVDFRIPFLKDPSKDPFAGMYMKREVGELLRAHVEGVNRFTTHEGLNGLMRAAHWFREYYSAWTLAPFPAKHARDLGSDMILAYQAGLNPVSDLAKVATGESAYAASAALLLHRAKLPAASTSGLSQTPPSLQGLMETVGQRFPDAEFNADRLLEWLQKERLVGADVQRDLDLGISAALRNDPVAQAARRNRSTLSKAVDWLPGASHRRSAIIGAGLAVGEKAQSFTKTALFVHKLREGLPMAKSLDDALNYATFETRKHLFDYADLTSTERNVLRLAIPFYTFSAKNIPLQIEKAITDPGKNAWLARAYNSAWGARDEDEIAPEDLPDWLGSQLGLPMWRTDGEDGSQTHWIWSPRGWLPQTELNEIADVVREGGFRAQLMGRINPLLKEPIEQVYNMDAFTGRAIDSNEVRDMFGYPNLPPRVVHLLRNVRLLTELDRLNPGDAWSAVWEEFNTVPGQKRPHRQEGPQTARWAQFFTGINLKGIEPLEQQSGTARREQLAARDADGLAKFRLRQGNRVEAAKLMEVAAEHMQKSRSAQERVHALRRGRAVEFARTQQKRGG